MIESKNRKFQISVYIFVCNELQQFYVDFDFFSWIYIIELINIVEYDVLCYMKKVRLDI